MIHLNNRSLIPPTRRAGGVFFRIQSLAAPLAIGCSSLIGCAADSENAAPGAVTEAQQEVQPRELAKIGLQLYTLRAELGEDFEGTLRKVAELGYEEVEFDGLFGNDPLEVKALLDEIGLDPVSYHAPWGIVRTRPEEAIAEAVALGSQYLVFAWMPGDLRDRRSEWESWVGVFNNVASLCKDAGLQFAYHNHDFEFQDVEGILPYDLILNGIDRELVQMELDLYWLALGGEQPAPLFERYPGGFPLAHVKDMGVNDEMVDVGDGILDFGDTFARSADSGMKHFFVEHDDTVDPFLTAERSIAYLKELKF